MFEAKFIYPEYGYLYLNTEKPQVTLSIVNKGDTKDKLTIDGNVIDYYKQTVQNFSCEEVFYAGEQKQITFDINCKKLGHYWVNIILKPENSEEIKKVTGLGYTTFHERSSIPDSCFGISGNLCVPKLHYPIFSRAGIRYIRQGDPDKHRRLLEKYGLQLFLQKQGYDILNRYYWNRIAVRWAPYKRNSAYYYEKFNSDCVFYMEHGNEHWEDAKLMQLAEWTKTSGLARLEANASGWYANSGSAGVDVNKLRVLFDNGVGDYITSLAMHAYSFSGSPEGTDSYWSVERLRDLANLMNEYNIKVPVCCTEQGYPVLYDQEKCESYSPGEMTTFEGQAEYLVRSWLMYLSLGVSKVVWFNGPWMYGFGILEKEGPAPYPAVMALTQLIRAIDHCDYVGDYKKENGVYYKIFRNRNTSKLIGVIWRPVYYSRSCYKDKNLSLDGKYYESEGKAQEIFDYKLHDIDASCVVKDIMGNEVSYENDTIKIGESPLYIYNIKESIIPKLTDETIFPVKQVVAKPLPSKIILGLHDASPIATECFLSSRFKPGETRKYILRVHNYSDVDLKDTIVIDAPKPFKVDKTEIDVEVLPGVFEEYPIFVKCDDVANSGEFKIHAKSKTTDAHPVYSISAVLVPLYFNPIDHPITIGDELSLCFTSYAGKTKTYTVSVGSNNDDVELETTLFNVEAESGKTLEIPLKVKKCTTPCEPVVTVTLSDGENTTTQQIAIPMSYVEYSKNVDADSLKDKQKFIVSGYNFTMSAGELHTGPELFGNAKPEPLNSYSRIEMDDKKLYVHMDIKDATVVCNKVTRRNNIDSDGVWLKIYSNFDDNKPLRHFCVMPVDQAGNTRGCSVNEVSEGILFACPHTDYDFSKIKVKSEVFDDYYTIDMEIDRDSIGLSETPEELILNIRVIDMDHKDWPRFYDTGKRKFKIINK